ncbi:MAG: hypothetical protein JWO30_1088 [Fibrobacteres bacterium]|nr:hypothetical protein [Fibrobacterota bacterium]
MESNGKSGFGRREFIGAAAAALFAGVVIQITGCGTDSSDETQATQDGSATGTISNNHPTPHKAVITKARVDAGGALDLDIQGAADHTHTVSLSADDMINIKAKIMVMMFSSDGGTDPHNHMVMFN